MAKTTAVCGAKQRRQAFGDLGQRGRLRGHDDDVLRAQLPGFARRRDPRVYVAIGRHHAQAVGSDGLADGRAGNDRDIGAAARQPCREMAADRAGSVDANFHGVPIFTTRFARFAGR